MAMGSTGTVNITPEMMKNALDVIEEYQKNTNDLHTKLTEAVETLTQNDFKGSAATGFVKFYNTKIESAIGEGLTNLLTALHDIVQGTLEAIPDTDGLDDQLGEGNQK